jgi:hypothetical protein
MTRLYRTCGNEANIQAPQVVAPIVKRSPSFKTRTPSGGGSTSSSGTAPMPTITDENGVSSSAFRRGDLVEVLQVDEDEVKKEEDNKTEKSKEAEEKVPGEPLGMKAALSEGGDDDTGSDDPSSPKEPPPPPSKVEVAEAEPTQVKKEAPKEAPKEEVWLKARIVRVFAGGVTVRYMDKDEMEEVFDLSRVSSLVSTNSHNNTAPTQEADESGLSAATKDDQEEEEEEEEEGKEPELAPDPNLPDWLQSGPIEPPKPKPKAEKKATATKTTSDVKFGDEYEVTFSAGRMGFRLQQDPRSGAAMVVHVVPYEAASCAGVKVGDVVVGMEGHYVPHYETIMSWLSSVKARERGRRILPVSLLLHTVILR